MYIIAWLKSMSPGLVQFQYIQVVPDEMLLRFVISGSAQGMGKDTPERAPAAQQSAPAEKIAPSMKNGDHKAPQTTGVQTGSLPSARAWTQAGNASCWPCLDEFMDREQVRQFATSAQAEDAATQQTRGFRGRESRQPF